MYPPPEEAVLKITFGVTTPYKNNKKIFEGDILNLYSWEEEGDTVKRIIEFKDGEYIIKEITDKDPVYCNVSMIGLEDCEIIGNIYENPKLMEEK